MTQIKPGRRRITKSRLRNLKSLPGEVWKKCIDYPRYMVSTKFRVKDNLKGVICNQQSIGGKSHVIVYDQWGKPHSRRVYMLVIRSLVKLDYKDTPDRDSPDEFFKLQSIAYEQESDKELS